MFNDESQNPELEERREQVKKEANREALERNLDTVSTLVLIRRRLQEEGLVEPCDLEAYRRSVQDRLISFT